MSCKHKIGILAVIAVIVTAVFLFTDIRSQLGLRSSQKRGKAAGHDTYRRSDSLFHPGVPDGDE